MAWKKRPHHRPGAHGSRKQPRAPAPWWLCASSEGPAVAGLPAASARRVGSLGVELGFSLAGQPCPLSLALHLLPLHDSPQDSQRHCPDLAASASPPFPVALLGGLVLACPWDTQKRPSSARSQQAQLLLQTQTFFNVIRSSARQQTEFCGSYFSGTRIRLPSPPSRPTYAPHLTAELRT